VTPEQFHQEFGPEFAPDPNPYGNYAQPVKPGMTKRGKTAMAVGVTVLAVGGFLTWQHYETEAKASEVQAQELQYKRDLLALEMQKELNKANAADKKAQETHDAAQQKQIQACVDADKGLIGKQLGVTYHSVLQDCQAQHRTSSSAGTDMQEAASSSGTSGGGSGVNEGLAIGGGILLAGLFAVARRSSRNTPNYNAA